ncbi:MAG: DUF1559 domain-containing protein, partial [Planctomycetota bacterium]
PTLTNLDICRTVVELYICPSDPSEKTLTGGNNVVYPNWCWEASTACSQSGIAITTYKGINGRTFDATAASVPVPQAMYDRRMGYLRQPTDRPYNRIMQMKDVLDGTSNTLIVGEISPAWQAWGFWAGWHSPITTAYPINYLRNVYHSREARIAATHGWPQGFSASSFHPGGAQFLMVDASVHFISETVNFTEYQQLADPDDGLPVGGFNY